MSYEWFAVHEEGPAHVLSLTVPLHADSADIDRMHEQVLTAVASRPDARWVIDLSGLHYMGSSMLGLLVNVRQRIRAAGGKLALCGMGVKLLQVFRTCSLEKLFVIKPGRQEAVETVSR